MKLYVTIFVATLALTDTLVAVQDAGVALVTLEGREHAAKLDPDQSDWSGAQESGSVSMTYRAVDRAALAIFSGLSSGFESYGTTADNPELDIVRLTEGKLERLFSKKYEDEGGLVVKMESISADGPHLILSGTLSGRMGTSDNFGRTVYLSEPLDVNSTFSAVLDKLE